MPIFTEFWKLKKVIVWNVQNYNLDKLDITFKIAYWENMKLSNFDTYKDYKVDKQKIIERTTDLDNLADLLKKLWVVVYRPEELSDFKTFKTPYSKGVLNAISSPRDRVLIYWDKIIETPPMWTKRYFENLLFYKLFFYFFDEFWFTWISAPNPFLSEDRIDMIYWKDERDFSNFDRKKYDISFDAANILKIGKDLIFNIATFNHELWADWLQRVLWKEVNVHKVYQIDDNHIDWKLNVLKPWVFLVSMDYEWKDIRSKLPEKFRNWDIIFTSDLREERKYMQDDDLTYLELCSERWADTNVLSVDENTVLCLDHAINTIDILRKNWFTVIPVQLRHCEIFWWWLHCATLDVERDDEFIDYTL